MSIQLQTLLANIPLYAGLTDAYGATHLPVYNTATYDLKRQQDTEKTYDYSRSDNPTRNALEKVFALAEEGASCTCVNSGLAAIKLLIEAATRANDTILVEKNCYGGTFRMLKIALEQFNIQTLYVDFTQEDAVEAHLKNQDVRLVLCESPTNPNLKIIDLVRIAALCRQYDALLAVDNSMATFASQQPLLAGADFSIFSSTKFISGHGSVTAGAVVSKTPEWGERIAYLSNAYGLAQSPFDCYLVSLGLPTLIQRMKAQEQSALQLARYLEQQDWVETVLFPGLPSHPQYELAAAQLRIIPSIISVTLREAGMVSGIVRNLRLFGQKVSFGCADSRIELPADMSHASLSEAELNAHGLSRRLIRLSVGLEDSRDLIRDFENAVKLCTVCEVC